MIAVLPKIKAVVGDHPDPMSDPAQNPDQTNYKINKTPVFIITGTFDHIEPLNSGWQDFSQITSPTRIFIDVASRGHLEPLVSQDEAVPIVNFYKAFVYKTISPAYLYDPTTNVGTALKIAPEGSRDTGAGGLGYLACVHSGSAIAAVSVPAGHAK